MSLAVMGGVSFWGAGTAYAADGATVTHDDGTKTTTVTTGDTGSLTAYGNSADGFTQSDVESAEGYTVEMSGGVVNNVYGGYVSMSGSGGTTATANQNTVNISSGQVNGIVYGGYAKREGTGSSAIASNNTVNISGGQVNRNVYGAYVDAAGTASAS